MANGLDTTRKSGRRMATVTVNEQDQAVILRNWEKVNGRDSQAALDAVTVLKPDEITDEVQPVDEAAAAEYWNILEEVQVVQDTGEGEDEDEPDNLVRLLFGTFTMTPLQVVSLAFSMASRLSIDSGPQRETRLHSSSICHRPQEKAYQNQERQNQGHHRGKGSLHSAVSSDSCRGRTWNSGHHCQSECKMEGEPSFLLAGFFCKQQITTTCFIVRKLRQPHLSI